MEIDFKKFLALTSLLAAPAALFPCSRAEAQAAEAAVPNVTMDPRSMALCKYQCVDGLCTKLIKPNCSSACLRAGTCGPDTCKDRFDTCVAQCDAVCDPSVEA